jgi:hypothetical protein
MITHGHQEDPVRSVRRMCQSLHVNRAWWYAHQRPVEPSEEEIALRNDIEQITLDVPGYGYRRVTRALQRMGWSVNHKRVMSVLQEESLWCH